MRSDSYECTSIYSNQRSPRNRKSLEVSIFQRRASSSGDASVDSVSSNRTRPRSPLRAQENIVQDVISAKALLQEAKHFPRDWKDHIEKMQTLIYDVTAYIELLLRLKKPISRYLEKMQALFSHVFAHARFHIVEKQLTLIRDAYQHFFADELQDLFIKMLLMQHHVDHVLVIATQYYHAFLNLTKLGGMPEKMADVISCWIDMNRFAHYAACEKKEAGHKLAVVYQVVRAYQLAQMKPQDYLCYFEHVLASHFSCFKAYVGCVNLPMHTKKALLDKGEQLTRSRSPTLSLDLLPTPADTPSILVESDSRRVFSFRS